MEKETSLSEKISHVEALSKLILVKDLRETVLGLKEDMCFVMVRSKGFCNTCKNCVKINKRFGDKLTETEGRGL